MLLLWIDERFTELLQKRHMELWASTGNGGPMRRREKSLGNVTNLLFRNSPILYWCSGQASFFISESCQICFHQVTQKKDPNLTLTIVLTRNKKRNRQTTKRSAETNKKKRITLEKVDVKFPGLIRSKIRRRLIANPKKMTSEMMKTMFFRSCFQFGTHATHFSIWRKMKKKNQQIWWGVCKWGKGDRRSHVRLAVSQAGAILTDWQKLRERRGQDSRQRSGGQQLQESPWWQIVDLEFGIPFPLVLQCQCLLLLLSLVDLPSRGISLLLSQQKQQRKLDYIFSYLE